MRLNAFCIQNFVFVIMLSAVHNGKECHNALRQNIQIPLVRRTHRRNGYDFIVWTHTDIMEI